MQQRLPPGLRAAQLREVLRIVSQVESSGELSSRSSASSLRCSRNDVSKRACDMDSAAATAAVKSAGEARLHEIAKQSATKQPELAERSDGVGPCWSRANVDSAAATAAVKSAGRSSTSRHRDAE